MKIIFKIVTISIFLTNHSFPQFYAEDEISSYIIEFMEIADEFSKLYGPGTDTSKIELSDIEIERIAELYYRAYDEDPVGFSTYIREAHSRWGATVRGSGGKISELKPAMKRMLLKKEIAKKYGITFAEVIGSPAILRVKFISLTRSSYYWAKRKTNIGQMNFNFLIEDILKGEKFFIIGDTVTVLMIPNGESPNPSFKEDNSYLISVKPRFESTKYNGHVGFNYLHEYYDRWVMGVPPKTFPIEDEIIVDCDYLGIKDTNWVDFKDYFKKSFLIFN